MQLNREWEKFSCQFFQVATRCGAHRQVVVDFEVNDELCDEKISDVGLNLLDKVSKLASLTKMIHFCMLGHLFEFFLESGHLRQSLLKSNFA